MRQLDSASSDSLLGGTALLSSTTNDFSYMHARSNGYKWFASAILLRPSKHNLVSGNDPDVRAIRIGNALSRVLTGEIKAADCTQDEKATCNILKDAFLLSSSTSHTEQTVTLRVACAQDTPNFHCA